jgi:hypothetical protein
MRYFFDLIQPERSLFDYRGDEFNSLHAAQDFAMTTAQRLSNTISGEWSGWTVEVRCAAGRKHFSLPINGPMEMAA